MRPWRVLSVAVVVGLLPSLAAAAGAKNCSDAVLKCQSEGRKHADAKEKCAAAGAQCQSTGTFVGPYSGRKWTFKNR